LIQNHKLVPITKVSQVRSIVTCTSHHLKMFSLFPEIQTHFSRVPCVACWPPMMDVTSHAPSLHRSTSHWYIWVLFYSYDM